MAVPLWLVASVRRLRRHAQQAQAAQAFGSGIALPYGALYVLRSREQTVPVMGAVLRFAVLAAVTALTRQMDGYGLTSGNSQGE